MLRALTMSSIAISVALLACERIADVDQYHVCSGAECDAGTKETETRESGTEECSGIDAGTEACGACLARSCATAEAACRCDSVCVREVDCYIHSHNCSACERTKTTTTALVKCAADSCAAACSCR